jgi:hypothetical protein
LILIKFFKSRRIQPILQPILVKRFRWPFELRLRKLAQARSSSGARAIRIAHPWRPGAGCWPLSPA